MDWNAAIERHRTALKRVLATLAALAGLTYPHPEPVEGAGEDGSARQDEAEALAVLGEGVTLPRRLHRAVLRLLRPAEAAARRLVIVAARDIETPPPPPRFTRSPSPASQGRITGRGRPQRGSSPVLRGVSSRFADGKSVVPMAQWKAGERRDGAKHRGPGRNGGGMAPAYPTRIALPLIDPLRRLPHKRLRASATAMPRISIPGWNEPAPLPVLPTPYDPIDATRLILRLAAISRALDDLPREARRFARWRGRVAAGAQNDKTNGAGVQADESRHAGARQGSRIRRTWPLRLGRPPGSPSGRRPAHKVHQILEDVHGLAFWVLEPPDTS